MSPLLQTRRQSLALVAAGLALPGAAAAAASPAASLGPVMGPAELPEAQFTPEGGSTDLMGMEDLLRRMTAPVMINGQGPFDFVVDTGTNRSVISDVLAAQLNLPTGRLVHLHGIGGERDVPTAKLDRFEVGARGAAKLSLPVLPAKSLNCAGILGVDGLKDQRVVLDLREPRLKIEPSSSPDRNSGTVVKTRRKFGQLTVVDTDLDGIQVSVMIDTGAEITIGNFALQRALDSRRRRGREVALQRITLLGATGDTAYGDSGGLPKFRIGRLEVTNMRVVYSDLHPFTLWKLEDKPAVLMGMDVIRFFDLVSIDYGRNEVRFALPAQPYIDPAGDIRRN